MSYGTARQSNVIHLPPAPVHAHDQALISTYEMHAEDYLVACFAGAPPNIIIERAARMFHAREALRKRGILTR